jgi:mycothiol synthase
MMTGVDIRDSAAKAFVEGMGLRMNRDGVRMEWAPRPLPEVSLSPGYRLRTYKAGDEEEWANLINRSYATTPNGTDYTAEKVLENWVNTPCFMPDGSFFVTHRGSMVGCFMAWREVNEGPRRGRLHWLAVDPDHRRRGIAKFLTVRVISHLQAKGLTSIFLDTGHNLPVAMHMYRKMGFVETPRLFDYVRDLDQSQSGRASV